MTRNTRLGLVILCLSIALLTAAASAAGVFWRGTGATILATSIRGERLEVTTDGVYPFNARRIVAEGVGWDLFTLFAVVPALLAALPGLLRGSLRGRLFVIGLLAYLFYQYLVYAMTWAFGPLFLPFVALYAASLAAIVWLVSTVDVTALSRGVSGAFPRRGMAALCLIVSLALVGMWLQRIVAGLRGDLEAAMLLGQTTMVVQALDLGLVVPLAVFTAVVILRRRPVGFLLGPVFVVKAVAMASAICAMILGAWSVEGRLDKGALAFFGGAALASLWLGLRMYRSLPNGADAPASIR